MDNGLSYTKEHCSVCDAVHTMLDGGDIIDCMIYYRHNIEPKEIREEREAKIEVWDPVKKEWNYKVRK